MLAAQGYEDYSTYPRGLLVTTATVVATEIFPATADVRVAGIIINNAAAATRVCRLSNLADTQTYWRITIPASTTRIVPVRFFVRGGLAYTGGGSVTTTIFYWKAED